MNVFFIHIEMLHKLCVALGWYCVLNATSAMETVNGGQCIAGYYCPEGSYEMTSCDPGMYCQVAGLDLPTGNCSAGKSCTNCIDTICMCRSFQCNTSSIHVYRCIRSLGAFLQCELCLVGSVITGL